MGEEADCGPSKDKSTWFLSYAHAKREAASAQVTKKDGRPYSLGSDFGHHCCSIFQACGYKDVSVLKENGIGLELYFKYLKFMIAMFFVLSLLSLPALIGFYQGRCVCSHRPTSPRPPAAHPHLAPSPPHPSPPATSLPWKRRR